MNRMGRKLVTVRRTSADRERSEEEEEAKERDRQVSRWRSSIDNAGPDADGSEEVRPPSRGQTRRTKAWLIGEMCETGRAAASSYETSRLET